MLPDGDVWALDATAPIGNPAADKVAMKFLLLMVCISVGVYRAMNTVPIFMFSSL
jgi:hypothetical protein